MAETLYIIDEHVNKNRQKINYLQLFWICVILTFAAAAVYSRIWTYDFIDWDDPVMVYKNPNIQAGITLASVQWALYNNYWSMWHPLTWISYMLDWRFFDSNAGGFHLINLVLHIANTLLLFIVLRQMTGALWQSAFVAALFALHPLHVESVAWISERKDVLSTFFWLLTMWAYVRYIKSPKIINYRLIVILFACGLMSKAMLVTLPFVLLLLDYWPLERFPPKHSFSYLLIEKFPLFVMTLAASVITFIAQKEGKAMPTSQDYIPFLFRLANASISYIRYIIKMVWPAGLAVFYPHPGRSVAIPFAVISAVLLLAITILIIRFAKNHKYLTVGWFWYLGTLVPVIGIIQVGRQAWADRYSYITLTGLFIIIAWGLPDLLEKWTSASSVGSPRRKTAICWASALIVLFALAVCANIQQRYWKNSITLFSHTLEVAGDNYIAHSCLAEELLRQGHVDEAIRHYRDAVQIKPDYLNAVNGLGLALYKAGRIAEAIGYYKKAIEIDPCVAAVYINLGAAFAAEGKFAQAVKEYEKALLIQPQNAAAHNNLGTALLRQGKFDEAIEHFHQALRIAPDFTAAKNGLDSALFKKQRIQSTGNTGK